jgi:hypothetical protein
VLAQLGQRVVEVAGGLVGHPGREQRPRAVDLRARDQPRRDAAERALGLLVVRERARHVADELRDVAEVALRLGVEPFPAVLLGQRDAAPHVGFRGTRLADGDVGEPAVHDRPGERLRIGRSGVHDPFEQVDRRVEPVERVRDVPGAQEHERVLALGPAEERGALRAVGQPADQVAGGGEVDETVGDGARLRLGERQGKQHPGAHGDDVEVDRDDGQDPQRLFQQFDGFGRSCGGRDLDCLALEPARLAEQLPQ